MTYCRFCLQRPYDMMASVKAYIYGMAGMRGLEACNRCFTYLSLLPGPRAEYLAALARRYAWARRDVA